ncbi:MAG: neutral zinc metallopeptidase [Acidobacteriota bacterium]|nr:MAG: neutral zinc metallopeptidase [Acidobacteriota bacterium]
MRWTRRARSANLEDRRGQRVPRRGTVGCGTLLVLIALSVVFKQDFLSLLGPALVDNTGGGATSTDADFRASSEEEELVDFMSFVLDDLQATWQQKLGRQYRDANMVLFRDAVQSACGVTGAATGPFYCPGDGKVYLDLSFFDELRRRFGAPGDFAQAYVIAHEIGHHVQNLLGIERQVRQLQAGNPGSRNNLSVRMELQADCLAGVWGYSTAQRGVLEQGDVEEGLDAAAAIGDDRIQRQTQGYVVPDAFTHGSSAERVEWFKRGLMSGDPDQCDTFSE